MAFIKINLTWDPTLIIMIELLIRSHSEYKSIQLLEQKILDAIFWAIIENTEAAVNPLR